MKTLPLFLSASLLTGCNALVNKHELDYVQTRRAPVPHVEIFKDNQFPTRKYTTLAEMSWTGPRSDELRAQQYFTGRACQLGADALIFVITDPEQERHSAAFGGPGGFAEGSSTSSQWYFKAKAILYEPKP